MSEQELRFAEALTAVVRESGLPPDCDAQILAQVLCGVCRAAGTDPMRVVAGAVISSTAQRKASA